MKKTMAAAAVLAFMLISMLVSCSDMDELSYSKDQLSTASLIKKSNELAELARQKKSAIIEGYPNIGVIMPALDNGGWMGLFMGAVKGIYKNKIGMVAFSADNDVSLQCDIIDDLIAKKIDGIVFVPTDSGELSKMVSKANAAKIPIISMDRSTVSGKLDGLVESDNLEFGKVAAKKLIQIVNNKELKPIGDDRHIIIITVDGQPIGLDNIRKDYVDIDISQDIHKMGELAIDLLLKKINGQKIEDPFIRLPPKIIDKSNVNDPDLWGNQFR